MTENILDKWGGANSWFCLNRNFSDRGNDGQCQEMGQSSPLLHFAHKMWPNLRPVGWLCLSDLWVSFFSGPPTSFLVCETSVHSQNPWCGTICVIHTLPRFVKFWMMVVVVVVLSHSVVSNSFAIHGLPGSSVYGDSQARILEWVAISSSRGFPQPRARIHTSCIGRWVLYHWGTWKITWEEWCITYVKNKNSKLHV